MPTSPGQYRLHLSKPIGRDPRLPYALRATESTGRVLKVPTDVRSFTTPRLRAELIAAFGEADVAAATGSTDTSSGSMPVQMTPAGSGRR